MKHAFGLKVIDRHADKIEPLIDLALQKHLPIEVGFYFNEDESVNLIHDKLSGYQKLNTHLNHRIHDLFTADKHLHLVEHSIKSISHLGSKYSVIHVGTTPMSKRSEHKAQLFSHLMKNIIALEKICEKYDHHLHIENVFDDVAFHRELADKIKQAKLSHMHFCFDIGHAKVWSTDPLADWLHLTNELHNEQFNIHFHLHWNDGLFDQHLTIMEAEQQNLIHVDKYCNPMNYLDAIQHIHETYPTSHKIFEVEPELAIENIDATLDLLLAAKQSAA